MILDWYDQMQTIFPQQYLPGVKHFGSDNCNTEDDDEDKDPNNNILLEIPIKDALGTGQQQGAQACGIDEQ